MVFVVQKSYAAPVTYLKQLFGHSPFLHMFDCTSTYMWRVTSHLTCTHVDKPRNTAETVAEFMSLPKKIIESTRQLIPQMDCGYIVV